MSIYNKFTTVFKNQFKNYSICMGPEDYFTEKLISRQVNGGTRAGRDQGARAPHVSEKWEGFRRITESQTSIEKPLANQEWRL